MMPFMKTRQPVKYFLIFLGAPVSLAKITGATDYQEPTMLLLATLPETLRELCHLISSLVEQDYNSHTICEKTDIQKNSTTFS